MSDFSHTKITFPPPPPTCNTLTAAQRTHLLKSTKKIGRVLGATPQVLDETHPLGLEPTTGPLIVQLHFGTLRAHNATTVRQYRRGSFDSLTSSCSSYESGSSTKPIISGPLQATDNYPNAHADSWRLKHAKKRPPHLKLAYNDPTRADSILLEPITPTSSSPPSSPVDDIRYSLALPVRDARSSLYAESPKFSIPSESTIRREKMERVKRKLGDEVPVDLVFPSRTDPDDDPTLRYSPPPSPPPPNPRTETQPRLAMQYGVEAYTEPNVRKNLGPIMEHFDEQRTTSSLSHYPESDETKRGPSVTAEEPVDVDLDKMFRQMAQGLRRRIWAKSSTSESDIEMIAV